MSGSQFEPMELKVGDFRGRRATLDPRTLVGTATTISPGVVQVRLDDTDPARSEFWLVFTITRNNGESSDG